MNMTLQISNLSITISDKTVLNNFSLTCLPGSLHALMGPNGSGKSSLASAIMGHPSYTILSGSLNFNGHNLADMPIEKRARAGIFLAFQYPYEITGVKVKTYLQESYRALKGTNFSLELFQQKLAYAFQAVGLSLEFTNRYLNDGFSGGEKKRLELAQMLIFEPHLAILDEIDSGLDTDGLNHVIKALQTFRDKNPSSIIVLISHYPLLVQALQADFVHILVDGALVHSGDQSVALHIQTKGYNAFSTI